MPYDTPFICNTFQSIWKSHFKPNNKLYRFNFIEGIDFYKTKFTPVFFNIGKNLTKGNNYLLKDLGGLKNKALVIYDVLAHAQKTHDIPETNKKTRVYKSVQYSGFLINLNKFENLNEYMQFAFGRNSRMKMRKYSRKLNQCFDFKTKMFFGEIEKKQFDDLFDQFMNLLEKRYSQKQIMHNNMQLKEWQFYKKVAYPLILKKRASLFVVYDGETPIAITYNYHTKNSIIDAITAFDIDYSKFNIGYITNLSLLDWCFKNNINTFDFSKGFYEYKKRMSTSEYNFEYHIIYNSSSFISKTLAFCYYNYFEFKSFLRKRNYNEKFHQLTYKLNHIRGLRPKKNILIEKIDSLPQKDNLISIDLTEDDNFCFLRKVINNFLYVSESPFEEINTFKRKDISNAYILSDSNFEFIQEVKIA